MRTIPTPALVCCSTGICLGDGEHSVIVWVDGEVLENQNLYRHDPG